MSPRTRSSDFCAEFGLKVPIIMGPMAGSYPPALVAEVANAGGMGGCGALLMDGSAIADWASLFRLSSGGAFQINTWIPDPEPTFRAADLDRTGAFLAAHGVEMGAVAHSGLPDFDAQCDAIIAACPAVASSIMGLYPPDVVARMHAADIKWFAAVTSVAEARAAYEAGADALVVSGVEAGGHRGAFDPGTADRQGGTLFTLLPIIADAVPLPLIAAGGIADGRGVAAALTLGASAVQIGTALLRTPQAGTPAIWADALARTMPEDTVLTRAYSGRLARAVRNEWIDTVGDAALPYPAQRQAVAPLRSRALATGDESILQMWAGQAASLARAEPASHVVWRLWAEADRLLA